MGHLEGLRDGHSNVACDVGNRRWEQRDRVLDGELVHTVKSATDRIRRLRSL